MIDKKFIINLQGKEFITFEGLLNEFHVNGGKNIDTNIISENPFIIKATVTGEKGTYTGIGDADDTNVNKLIAKHKIRMAETRAIARALRWYNNIGMCSADELGGEDSVIGAKQPTQKTQEQSATPEKEYECSKCKVKIPAVVNSYSMKIKGMPLCRKCQKE